MIRRARVLLVALAVTAPLSAQSTPDTPESASRPEPAAKSAPVTPPRTGEFRAPVDPFRPTFREWLLELFSGKTDPGLATKFSDFQNSDRPPPTMVTPPANGASSQDAAAITSSPAGNIAQPARAIVSEGRAAPDTRWSAAWPLLDASRARYREAATALSSDTVSSRAAPSEARSRGTHGGDGTRFSAAPVAWQSAGGAAVGFMRPAPLPAPIVTEVPSLEALCKYSAAARPGALRSSTAPKTFASFSAGEEPGSPAGDLPAGDPPITSIVLSTFSGNASDGAIISTSSWATPGNVTQGAGTITIGGAALSDNGWGATHLLIDASGMSFLNITAQRLPGNAAPSLFIQFADRNLTTHVVSLSTSLFGADLPTLAQVPLGLWAPGFDATQIASWSIGGGDPGTLDFRMRFDHAELSLSAIPEPSTYAAWIGLATLAFAVWRRGRVGGR